MYNLASAAAPKVESKIEAATLLDLKAGCALSTDLLGKANLGYGDLNHHGIFTEKNLSFKLPSFSSDTHLVLFHFPLCVWVNSFLIMFYKDGANNLCQSLEVQLFDHVLT